MCIHMNTSFLISVKELSLFLVMVNSSRSVILPFKPPMYLPLLFSSFPLTFSSLFYLVVFSFWHWMGKPSSSKHIFPQTQSPAFPFSPEAGLRRSCQCLQLLLSYSHSPVCATWLCPIFFPPILTEVPTNFQSAKSRAPFLDGYITLTERSPLLSSSFLLKHSFFSFYATGLSCVSSSFSGCSFSIFFRDLPLTVM